MPIWNETAIIHSPVMNNGNLNFESGLTSPFAAIVLCTTYVHSNIVLIQLIAISYCY